MKTYSAIYKGKRVVELTEEVDLPRDIEVLVVIPGQEDEEELQKHLRSLAEVAFVKLWDNKEDEVWNEYL